MTEEKVYRGYPGKGQHPLRRAYKRKNEKNWIKWKEKSVGTRDNGERHGREARVRSAHTCSAKQPQTPADNRLLQASMASERLQRLQKMCHFCKADTDTKTRARKRNEGGRRTALAVRSCPGVGVIVVTRNFSRNRRGIPIYSTSCKATSTHYRISQIYIFSTYS